MSYNDLRKGRCSELGREYFITAVLADRKQLFDDFYTARLFIKTLKELEPELGTVMSWVVMPDHVHILFSLKQGSLANYMKLLKGRSSHRINAYLNKQGSIWQVGYFDRALRREENRAQVARYIVANPLRAGLISTLSAYPHWDSIYL